MKAQKLQPGIAFKRILNTGHYSAKETLLFPFLELFHFFVLTANCAVGGLRLLPSAPDLLLVNTVSPYIHLLWQFSYRRYSLFRPGC